MRFYKSIVTAFFLLIASILPGHALSPLVGSGWTTTNAPDVARLALRAMSTNIIFTNGPSTETADGRLILSTNPPSSTSLNGFVSGTVGNTFLSAGGTNTVISIAQTTPIDWANLINVPDIANLNSRADFSEIYVQSTPPYGYAGFNPAGLLLADFGGILGGIYTSTSGLSLFNTSSHQWFGFSTASITATNNASGQPLNLMRTNSYLLAGGGNWTSSTNSVGAISWVFSPTNSVTSGSTNFLLSGVIGGATISNEFTDAGSNAIAAIAATQVPAGVVTNGQRFFYNWNGDIFFDSGVEGLHTTTLWDGGGGEGLSLFRDTDTATATIYGTEISTNLINFLGGEDALISVAGVDRLRLGLNSFDLNDAAGNNFLSGSAGGVFFGNGEGGSSASVTTNGVFIGNGGGLTNVSVTGMVFTNFWSLYANATNKWFATNFPNSSYNGVYQFSSANSTVAIWTNGVRYLFYYVSQLGFEMQPGATADETSASWVYDNAPSGGLAVPSASWEGAQTGNPVTGTLYGWDSSTYFTARQVAGTNFNVSGIFSGTVTGAFSGTVTGLVSGSLKGNAAGVTNINTHPIYFNNYPAVINTLSDSEGTMFVSATNLLGTNTVAFAQAIPSGLTNSIKYANSPYIYTNGMVYWLGRGNSGGTNYSLFMRLTNSFNAIGVKPTLNMAGSVSGIGAQQIALGGTFGSASTDLWKFYPYYTNTSAPVINYNTAVSSYYTGLATWTVYMAGINDYGAPSLATTAANQSLACANARANGDTVIYICEAVPYVITQTGDTNWLGALRNMAMTNSSFPADLKVDMLTFCWTNGITTNPAAWLPDGLHPTAATVLLQNDFLFRCITNNFVFSQGQVNGFQPALTTSQLATLSSAITNVATVTNLLGANAYTSGTAGTLNTNQMVAQVTNLLSANAYTSGNVANLSSNQVIAMAGYAISGSNYLITIPVAATNQFLVGVPVGATNWLVDTNTAILWAGKAISGSNYWMALPANYTITNPNIALLNNQYIFVGGTNGGAAELIVTNNNPAAYVFIGAQADNGNGLTNYDGLWYNNSKFVPGSTWLGSTNDAGLEYNGAGNHFFDIIGAGSWLWVTKSATNSSAVTNAAFSQSAFNFKLPTQVNGNAVLTNLAISGDFGGNAVVSGQSATLALTNAAGFTNDVRAVVTNTPGNITTNGATALGQVPYFTNNLNGWGWYIPGAGTGGNVFSNTQSFFQSLIITNTLQVSNITPTQVLIGTNSISIGTNLTASSYILDVNSGSALGAAGAGLVARFTAGASSALIISNDTTIARLYLGHAGLSGGAAAFVVEKLSGAADGYWGENSDAGGYFFRGQGGFSLGGSTPAINIPSAGSGGGNIICTTNISLLGSEQISGTLKITNAVSVLANGSVSALYIASTNFLLMQTNYNNANWAPIPGQMKIICSNNWMFGVSDHSTNALFLIQP